MRYTRDGIKVAYDMDLLLFQESLGFMPASVAKGFNGWESLIEFYRRTFSINEEAAHELIRGSLGEAGESFLDNALGLRRRA